MIDTDHLCWAWTTTNSIVPRRDETSEIYERSIPLGFRKSFQSISRFVFPKERHSISVGFLFLFFFKCGTERENDRTWNPLQHEWFLTINELHPNENWTEKIQSHWRHQRKQEQKIKLREERHQGNEGYQRRSIEKEICSLHWIFNRDFERRNLEKEGDWPRND